MTTKKASGPERSNGPRISKKLYNIDDKVNSRERNRRFNLNEGDKINSIKDRIVTEMKDRFVSKYGRETSPIVNKCVDQIKLKDKINVRDIENL